jgi:hypothetical protein
VLDVWCGESHDAKANSSYVQSNQLEKVSNRGRSDSEVLIEACKDRVTLNCLNR